MEHAESPSLITLGLAADVSQEGPSFRWGLAISCLLHVLIIGMAMFIRFHTPTEEHFNAIDVALISLTDTPSPAPRKAQSSAPSPPQSPAVKPQPVKTPPVKSETVKPQPAPPTPAKVQPVEETLPPLPTQSASERLSDFLSGAIGSIIVPERQIQTPTTPSPTPDPSLPRDETPLVGKLHLPSSVPQLSRPTRLNPSEPLAIPQSQPLPSRKSTESASPTPSVPQEAAEPADPSNEEPTLKPTPALPELRQVTPFKKRQQEVTRSENAPSQKIEESIKQSLPKVPAPASTAKVLRKSHPLPPTQKKSVVPDMSLPQLAQIHPPTPVEQSPPRERMSDMMEQLLGEVKVPRLHDTSAPQVTQPSEASSPVVTPPVPTEMDQRIAKLSIPTVTPVESIKKRLQLLEVESSGSGSSSSAASPGTSRYQSIVQAILQDQWENKTPLVADAPLVVLKFRIARSGEITQVRVDQSSGNEYYDSAARRAVHAVNPLPPFPSEITDSSLTVRFHFIKTDTH